MPPRKKALKSWTPGSWLKELSSEFSSALCSANPTNGDIIKLYLESNCSIGAVTNNLQTNQLFQALSKDCLYHRINRLIDNIRTLSKNLNTKKPLIKSILSDKFNLNSTYQPTLSVFSIVTAPPLPQNKPNSAPCPTPISCTASSLSSPARQIPTTSPSTALTRRRSCATCISKNARIANLVSQLQNGRTHVKAQRKLVVDIKDTYNTKKVNQKFSRKDSQVLHWKEKYLLAKKEKARVEREVVLLKKKLNSKGEVLKTLESKCVVARKVELENNKLQKNVNALSKEIAQLKKLLKIQNLENDFLHSELNNSDSDEGLTIQLKQDKRQYSHETRQLIFWFIRENCPVEAISLLISRCAVTFGVQLTGSLPAPSTVADMAWQLGVLVDLQVADMLLKKPTCTLAFDATTLRGTHVNEIHFASDDQMLTASIYELPGGCGADYADHVISVIDDLSAVRSLYTGEDEAEVRQQITACIKSTLTDRVAANHTAICILDEKLEKNLVELHCNVHPLDSISTVCRSSLKKMSAAVELKSQTFGSDCPAANLIFAIAKLRYQGKGDPAGFKSFLLKNGQSLLLFPRYVGNRFHVLFHSAGKIFHHKALLIDYLENNCNSEKLGNAALGDITNQDIIMQLQALGLWGKLMTGPWMTLVYGDEKKREHLAMSPHFKQALQFCRDAEKDPGLLLTSAADAFGRPLRSPDPVLYSLQSEPPQASYSLSDLLSTLAKATGDKIANQMKKYLTGPFADPTPQMLLDTVSAPVHNMWAERTLGILDALKARAPNATLGFLAPKVMAQMNQTLEWIESKDVDEQKRMIQFSVGRGRLAKKMREERSKKIQEVMFDRQKVKSHQKDVAARNVLLKDVKGKLNDRDVDVESVLDDPLFSRIPADQVESVNRLWAKLDTRGHVDMIIEQIQWDKATMKNKVKKGRIISLRRKKNTLVPMVRVAYWLPEHGEASSVDSIFQFASFMTDVMQGTLIIL